MNLCSQATTKLPSQITKFTLGLVLLTLWGCQSTAPQQQPPQAAQAQQQPEPIPEAAAASYPTYISPELNITSYLKNPNESRTLTEQFLSPWSLMIPVPSPDGSQQFVVSNCLQALSAAQQGISPDDQMGFPQFRYGVVQCMALQLAQEMEAANQSFLSKRIVNRDFLQQMPASSAFVVTEQDAFRARTTQGSAEDISPVNRYQPYDDYRATFDLGFGSQTFTVLARGDVNDDGLEDALIQVVNTEYNGNYRLNFLYIVTQFDATSGLQLIGGY